MKISTLKNIGIFSTALFATASAVYLYSPVIGSHADSSATADINLSVGEVMSLTLSTDALNLSTNPNNFVSGVVSATASTNSQYGYTLTLEDVDNNTNLVHTNENIDAVVTSNFEGTKTSATMDNNTWGYSLDATDFSKIPVNGSATTIKTTNVPMTTASETTDVTFGAKVGNLTSGTYTDKVLFTIYTNGQPEGPDDNTMQSFRCSRVNIGDSFTLVDSRDGNEYTVKKLQDGKCWMTENLRIANKTITSADSNLPAGESYIIPASDKSAFVNEYNNIGAVYIDNTYGGYYNYYAATAGWDSSEAYDEESPKSICPKSWSIPTEGEYVYIHSEFYNSYDLMTGELGLVLAGGIENGEEVSQGSMGAYWTNTSKTNRGAYELTLDRGLVLDTEFMAKFSGLSVRCLNER